MNNLLEHSRHKIGPWSDCIIFGSPTNVINLTKAFTTAGVFIFRNGIASGKRVEVHILVSKY